MSATTIDAWLELVKTALVALDDFDSNNVIVWDGNQDPTDDIAAGCLKAKGVSALIYDLGGDADPDEAAGPSILADAAVEIFIDPTKRRHRSTVGMLAPGALRDLVMASLHENETLNTGSHCPRETKVTGYKPVADPNYIVYRIRLRRTIVLTSS